MLLHCVVLSSMFVCNCEGVVIFVQCFVVHYLVSFLVLQSSAGQRESWLLYFNAF